MKKSGEIRIIAGKWRGRKLKVASAPRLRPTPDKVRETLFNWLMHDITGARCLDLYAGSGALGFEALSRGASIVEMMEYAPQALLTLGATAKKFDAGPGLQIYKVKLPYQLPVAKETFDIVFLDPPYNENLVAPTCEQLVANNCIKTGTLIYIEAEASLQPLPVPASWTIKKSGTAGEVNFYLLSVD